MAFKDTLSYLDYRTACRLFGAQGATSIPFSLFDSGVGSRQPETTPPFLGSEMQMSMALLSGSSRVQDVLYS